MAACAVIAVTSLSAAAATIPPEGAALWAGYVGYGNAGVGAMKKDNSNNTSYMKFTECDENIKLWRF